MTVSQNAIRKRNRMTLSLKSPRLLFAALGGTLAARPETPVGEIAGFLPIFDANEPRFFRKFEQSAFDANLKQYRRACQSPSGNEPRGGLLHPVACGREARPGNRPFTIPHECRRKIPAK
jgi:hypothetical protein